MGVERGILSWRSTFALGTVTKLPVVVTDAAGLALSPNGETLYLLNSGSVDVMAYPLEGAGSPGPGKVLGKLQTRAGTAPLLAGLAVDGSGWLYVGDATLRAVQVLSAEGARLGLISLPEAPVACGMGGPQGRTLYVASRHAYFRVEPSFAGVPLALQK
jgi:sugar lactone lactonase YvrE